MVCISVAELNTWSSQNQIKYEFDCYAIRLSRLYLYTETAAQVFHLTHADANVNKD